MRAELLGEIVQYYRQRLDHRLVGLVLYGSRARGDASEQSDVDIMLLAEALPSDLVERARMLGTPKLDENDPTVSTRALTLDEYERDIAPIDLDVAIDGRVLFDPQGYVDERLSLIRTRIAEAGLHRDHELVWRWRQWPKRRDWAINWQGDACEPRDGRTISTRAGATIIAERPRQ